MKCDLTKGMDCPCCDRHNSFLGGHFGGMVETTNYSCLCGFTAILVLTNFNKYDSYKIEAMEEK